MSCGPRGQSRHALDQAGACLDEVGFVFLFAPHCHPAMRHVGKARMELGIRSLFNLIGPLSNPAPVTNVLMGVYSPDLSIELARMLQRVGKRAAFVVHGAGAWTTVVGRPQPHRPPAQRPHQ